MAYEERTIGIPLAKGVDVKSDEKVSGGLQDLENGILNSPGAIQKRNGHEVVGTVQLNNTAAPAITDVYAHGNDVVGLDGNDLWVLDGTERWQKKGGLTPNRTTFSDLNILELTVSGTRLPTNRHQILEVDVARNGAWEVWAYSVADLTAAGNGEYLHTVVYYNGAVVDKTQQFNTTYIRGVKVRYAPTQDRFFVCANDIGNTRLSVSHVDLSDPGTVSWITNTHNNFNRASYDVDVADVLGTEYLYFVYHNANILIGRVTTASPAAITNWTAGAGNIDDNTQPALIIGSDDVAYAFHLNGGVGKITAWDATAASGPTIDNVNTPGGEIASAIEVSSGDIDLIYTDTAPASFAYTNGDVHTFIAGWDGAAKTAYQYGNGWALASNIQLRNGKYYCLAYEYDAMAAADDSRRTYTLVRLDAHPGGGSSVDYAQVVTRALPDLGVVKNNAFTANGNPITPVRNLDVSGTNWIWGQERWFGVGTESYLPMRVEMELNYTPCAVEFNGNLCLSNGAPVQFDGDQVGTIGFCTPPGTPLLSETTGGSLDTLGTYQVIVVMEWVDDNGNVHQSAPSPSASVTLTGANNEIDVNMQCRITNQREVFFVAYRTTNGGTIFYRESAAQGAVSNDNQTASVTLSVRSADSTAESQEILYTTSEVSNNMPESLHCLTVRDDRLFGGGQDSRVWYTKKNRNRIGPEFSSVFVKDLPTLGGEIEAMGALDGSTYAVKKEKGIYEFRGIGPAPSGVTENFTDAREVPVDTGANTNTPVVVSNEGIYYTSRKGIQQIGRQLNVIFAGAPVETFNQYTPRSAFIIDDKQEIHFLSSSEHAVLDTLTGQWLWHNGYTVAGAATRDHVPITGLTGIYKKDTSFTDNATAYSLRVRTEWIKLSSVLAGFARLWEVGVVGDLKTRHTHNVNIYYDYNTTAAETITFDTDTLTSSAEQFMYRFKPKRQKCSAVQFEIFDTSQTGTMESYSISALVLKVGVTGGVAKTSTNNQV